MIANVQSDLGAWVRTLMLTPDFILKVGEVQINKDLFTSKELLCLYDPDGKTGTTANGLGRELSRAGIRQVMNGRPVKLPDGSQVRLYAVKNPEIWLTATPQQIVKHLSSEKKDKKSRKY
jgi:hypothetical protein